MNRSERALEALKRIAAANGGRLPQGAQQRVARDTGLSKAGVARVVRNAKLREHPGKAGRPTSEDEAALVRTSPQKPPAAHQTRKVESGGLDLSVTLDGPVDSKRIAARGGHVI